MRPLTAIRGQTTIVQTNNQMPALHPVGGATIISGGAQVRSVAPCRSRNFCCFLTFYRVNENFMFLHATRWTELLVFVIIFDDEDVIIID